MIFITCDRRVRERKRDEIIGVAAGGGADLVTA